GQKTWLLLEHAHDEAPEAVASLPLQRGVYQLHIDFVQRCDPDDVKEHRQQTGFQLRYAGPDTQHKLVVIPQDRLFLISKDRSLGDGIAGLSASAMNFLNSRYTSSLRDIRRTYQRAFKALLFAHRFGLSANRRVGGQSELGYLLSQKDRF